MDDLIVGCMECHNRPAMHQTMADGKIRMTCCHCHVLIDNGLPAPWHVECQRLHDEQHKGRLNGKHGIIITGRR